MERKLVIPGTLPNLNDYTKACRTVTRNRNFNAGAKMKAETEELIGACIASQLRGVRFDGGVTLRFKWYEPNRRRDKDNVAFAKKFVLDALVTGGVIETDGWRGVEGFTDEFFIDPSNPRVEVYIGGG